MHKFVLTGNDIGFSTHLLVIKYIISEDLCNSFLKGKDNIGI